MNNDGTQTIHCALIADNLEDYFEDYVASLLHPFGLARRDEEVISVVIGAKKNGMYPITYTVKKREDKKSSVER